MKKMFVIALPLLLFFVSCKKENKTCDLNSTNLAGSYKITAFTYKPDASSPPEDIFATYEACQKDDLIIFNANGTTIFQDAGVKCTPPGDDTGTWLLNGNDLTIDGDVMVVTTFNCSTMVLTQTGSPGETLTITLDKQ